MTIKIFDKEKIASTYELTTFFSELKIMKGITSPNFIKFLDFLETNRNYYLILEFCENGNLESELKIKSFFSE